MGAVGRTFLAGLVAVLPIVITISLLVWVGLLAERFFETMIKAVTYDSIYRKGMGLVAGIAIIYLVGLLLRAYVFRVLFEFGERLLDRVPIVKTIYGSVRDLMSFIAETRDKTYNQVVVVTMGTTGVRLVGLVTRRDFSACPKGMGDEETVAVYLPMSYQMGGFTILAPRSWLQPIEMSFEDAMRFTLTAAMSVGPKSIVKG